MLSLGNRGVGEMNEGWEMGPIYIVGIGEGGVE